jgi:hypothetical protein
MFCTCRRAATVALVAAALLTGCAGLQRNVKGTAAYDPTTGYVAGTFGSVEGSGFGLVLTDQVGRRFSITFGEAVGEAIGHDLTGLVALAPGDYRVTHWMTYSRGTGLGVQTFPFAEGQSITHPFELKPGHVVYLGRFDAAMHQSSEGFFVLTVYTEWSIRPRPMPADGVSPVIARTFPAFVAAPLECLLCQAPAPGGGSAAAPAPPPSPAYGKKEIVLHYRRPDRKYDGWGLWSWESFEAPTDVGKRGGRKLDGDRALAGVSWEKPLPPSGFDDFGAYWALDARDFGNGRVNYVIHRGPAKEQDGRDEFWLIADSKEGWVNAGDPRVYLSREQAGAAGKK